MDLSIRGRSRRRLAGKLTTGMAYTWGKSIDDGSSERADGDLPPDRRNIRSERGPSDFDRTHIFTSNFVWHLPRLARGPLAVAALRPALNGWQASGIARMWYGVPLGVTMSYDVDGIEGQSAIFHFCRTHTSHTGGPSSEKMENC